MQEKYEVIEKVGSDMSYDLVVEVINKVEKKVKIECYQPQLKNQVDEFYNSIKDEVYKILNGFEYSINIIISNKVPDKFVWLGRIEGAVQKVKEMS